ncbi:MAG: hypothetical protein V7K27_31755 [Nostoc sp.]|uniref:hypothetical protein n=1 Tax=Nostoc sp. TaxID=1180 RepID=UPI002FF90182
MESTLFSVLSANEEASLSGGFADINVPIAINVAVLNDGDVAQNATAIANSGNRNSFRVRNRARA